MAKVKKKTTKCFYCLVKENKDPLIIKGTLSYQIIGLEKPYINLYFHKECYEKIKDVRKFLIENTDKIMELHANMV